MKDDTADDWDDIEARCFGGPRNRNASRYVVALNSFGDPWRRVYVGVGPSGFRFGNDPNRAPQFPTRMLAQSWIAANYHSLCVDDCELACDTLQSALASHAALRN